MTFRKRLNQLHPEFFTKPEDSPATPDSAWSPPSDGFWTAN
jgi:hypothetical protein